MSKVKEFSIICLLSFSVVVGCFVFCRGFLLNRQVIKEKSSPCDAKDGLDLLVPGIQFCKPSPTFHTAIFVLLDAFRYDFVHRMPFLSHLMQQQEKESNWNEAGDTRYASTGTSSCAFKFIADPPTTTMQRLKALMSGTMPTFIDASANFNSYKVEEDNLIYQLHAAGKRIAFLGDDTWISLFPRSLFTSPYVEAHPSFNAWDLDTVDRAVNSSINRLLEPAHTANWDILIAHLLGVDHCGHRYGPSHPEMNRKLNEADRTIETIFNRMPPDTLLIVFGDHGMTKTGDHGGDSTNEVEAALIFISKQLKRSKANHPPFQCHSKVKNPVSVSQIDLAPTVSSLLSLPIPFSSIGQIIPNFLEKSDYIGAIMSNVAQVAKYVEEYPTMSHPDIVQAYETVQDAFTKFKADEKNSRLMMRFREAAELYLSSVKRVAVSTWTQFDMASIYSGIGISFLAIVALTMYIAVAHGREFGWTFVALSSGALSSVLMRTVFPDIGLSGVKLLSTTGLILFVIFLVYSSISSTSKNPSPPQSRISISASDMISLVLFSMTCFSVFSNSFVINEGDVLGSVLLATSSLHVLLQSIESGGVQEIKQMKATGFLGCKKIFFWKHGIRTSWLCLFFFCILLRTASLFFRCREELTECKEEFLLHKHLSSLPEDWIVHKCIRFGVALLCVAVFVVTFREWIMMREWVASSARPAAIIGKYVPTMLIVLTGAHWALEGLPFSLPQMLMLRPALSHFPFVYQTLTLVALVCIWFDPVLCAGTFKHSLVTEEYLSVLQQKQRKMENSKSKSKSRKNGSAQSISSSPDYENGIKLERVIVAPVEAIQQDMFASSILINCVFVVLLLVQVTATGITPAVVMIPYAISSILGLTVSSSSQNSWSMSIIWALASQYFFYGTGHQPVFSAIPWDSAFIGSTDALGTTGENSWMNWIRPGLAVQGNLHVSQIIFSMALPLVVYWRTHVTPISPQYGKNERTDVYSLGGKFIILHAAKLLACMVSAAHHRRHLMVWKIFAPKLIFEIVSFLVTSSTTVLSLVFITRVDYHYQKILMRERKEMNDLFPLNP